MESQHHVLISRFLFITSEFTSSELSRSRAEVFLSRIPKGLSGFSSTGAPSAGGRVKELASLPAVLHPEKKEGSDRTGHHDNTLMWKLLFREEHC